MATYILRRLLLIIPTLFGITLVCFVIINLAPGGPIEQRLQQLRFGGAMAGSTGASGGISTRGDTGVPSEVIEALKKQYGFDKPLVVRYGIWLKNIVTLNFGESFKYEEPVVDLISSKFPVSLMFGLTSLVLVYLISIPIGVYQAVRNGDTFDILSGVTLFVLYAVPPLILGILLLVFVAGKLNWFPLGGIHSDNYDSLTSWQKILDTAHHFVLPLICYMINSFTGLTVLMKGTMLDVIKLDYIRTARAKGLPERTVYLKHALRNALIPIITGMSGILTVFFAGSIIIESIFSIDGMGLLQYTALLSRDYNVLMALILFQSALFLLGRLLTDLLYVAVDPRIDFA